MDKRIFIGVDCGGTKTKAVAVDEYGNILGKSIGKGTNFNTMLMERVRQTIKSILDNLMEQVNISVYDSLYVGMSALDHVSSPELLEEFCGNVFDSKKTLMISDVLASLFGLTLGKPGVMLISGTGMIGLAKDSHDNLLISGGWGYLLGDEGSCFHIGQEGINAGIRDHEGIGMHTELLERIRNHFKIRDIRDLIQRIYREEKIHNIIAGFAQEVIAAYRNGDAVACRIINQTLKLLVSTYISLIDKTGVPDIKVGVYGGLFENNKDILTQFNDMVRQQRPNLHVVLPKLPPEIGVILYGLQERKIENWKEIRDNIINNGAENS